MPRVWRGVAWSVDESNAMLFVITRYYLVLSLVWSAVVLTVHLSSSCNITTPQLIIVHLQCINNPRWVRTAQEKLASPESTEPVTVPPSVSFFVRSKSPNTPPIAVHSAVRILSRGLWWVFGTVRAVGRPWRVVHTV
jgi:hypothetical protein